MRSVREFRSLSQSKPFFGKRTLKGCTSSRNADDIVLIDVDSDDHHDVIIVDLPECLLQKFGKHSASDVISIDDDGNEDENIDGAKGVDNPVTTSSDSCDPASTSSMDDLSKNKENCSKKFVSRNSYGFCSGSDFDSSDSDCSDCELMEGSSENLREQWEQAFLKRKNDSCPGHSRLEDHSGSRASCSAAQHCAAEQSRKKMQAKDLDSSDSTHPTCNAETFSTIKADGDVLVETFSNHMADNTHLGTNGKESESVFVEDYLSADTGSRFAKQFHDFHPPFCDEEDACQRRNVSSGLETDDCQVNEGKSYSYQRDHVILSEPCRYNCQASFEEHFGFDSSEACCDDIADFNLNRESENAGSYRIHILNTSREFGSSAAFPDECYPDKNTSFQQEHEFPDIEDPSYSDANLQKREKHAVNDGQKVDDACLCGIGSYERDYLMEDEHVVDICSGDQVVDDENDRPAGMGAESSQSDIIIDRQKLKETDEYKRAMEEELASRQKQLQIQAEEAQRLRKRKKAETMRLLDMERRQKQRLEEMRETQKKDEENMNLKEQLRANVRNELNKLELTCNDMASLLRGLGVHLAVNPSASEVQTAYKRAVLKFHPDRASRADLRQQVEAEERFKLISRMRERFLMAPA